MVHEESENLDLPTSITSRSDVGRLLRETKVLDEFLEQAAIREHGTPMKLPRTSRLMDELISANKLNPLIEKDRKQLLAFLDGIYKEAPVLYMSFNADPSPLFSQRLITWLRKEIHPLVLVQSGLQPSLGAGCTLRTPNKYFDMSLRERFQQKRGLLLQKLEGAQK